NNQIYKFDKSFINFSTDFLVSGISINGIDYDISDIEIKPLDTTTGLKNTDIPIMYPVSNIIELTFTNKLSINKNFIDTESIKLYINNLDLLYLTYNYIINNDQTIIKPKIVGIGKSETYIYMHDLIPDKQMVISIDFGLDYILSIVNNDETINDPINIPIYNTKYTLLDIFKLLDPNQFAFTLSNYNVKYQNLINNIGSYDQVYYKSMNLHRFYPLPRLVTCIV
ncbi:MAG: hypothetical protein EBX47_07530, partial [Synechococcaceae bacterium WB8_1B_057]|nr:hypothetical protein [Synechococcaceae bacterium WB8_1B_057]